MGSLTGKGLVQFAISKLGTPYVYGAKGANGNFTQAQLDFLSKTYTSIFTSSYREKAKRYVGTVCCDCSGLISWYTKKVYGSAQLYSQASERGLISNIDKAPVGAVLWKSGHVGVYIGGGYCVEEKGIDYGCVKSKISNTKFTHYLLFSFMEYDNIVITSNKKTNPYKQPTEVLSINESGESVNWLQWELREAGYEEVAIDGDFGKTTLKYLKKFQTSSKLNPDGVCGPITKKALILDK